MTSNQEVFTAKFDNGAGVEIQANSLELVLRYAKKWTSIENLDCTCSITNSANVLVAQFAHSTEGFGKTKVKKFKKLL